MSGGDIGYMLTRPIALVMLALFAISVALPFLRPARPQVAAGG
jgi:hypothetical protein